MGEAGLCVHLHQVEDGYAFVSLPFRRGGYGFMAPAAGHRVPLPMGALTNSMKTAGLGGEQVGDLQLSMVEPPPMPVAVEVADEAKVMAS
jgi:hypothetical protein